MAIETSQFIFISLKYMAKTKFNWAVDLQIWLALKHLEKHRWVLNTVATDALMLKHRAISIYSAHFCKG